MNRYAGLPPLPDRINRLAEIAVDLWWAWNAEGRAVFRSLDYQLWRTTAHNPVRSWEIPREQLERAAGDPRSSRSTTARSRRSTQRAPHNTVDAQLSPAKPVDRLLLGRVRAPSVAAVYAGGLPQRARRRYCKGGSDSACRIGVGFIRRVLQARLRRRLAGRSYERLTGRRRQPALTPDGKPCITAVPLGDRSVLVAVWRIASGA